MRGRGDASQRQYRVANLCFSGSIVLHEKVIGAFIEKIYALVIGSITPKFRLCILLNAMTGL